MTVFLHELKTYRKNTILWTLSLVGLISVFMSAFPAYSEGAEEIKKLFTGFPPELLKGFGMNVDIMFSVLGFYGFIFMYVVLCGSIQAMYLGTSLISKEFNRKTADFLFTKPKSRTAILTGKIAAGITTLLITDILFITAAYLVTSANSGQTFETRQFFMISFTLFLIEMMFFALGIMVSAILQRIKSVIGISLGTVFGFFVAGMLGAVLEEDKIKYFVPFQYYETFDIIKNSAYDSTFVLINILFVVSAIAASYIIYNKKDIHSV